MLKKIKTTSGEYWLIDHKKTAHNIIIGDAVRLTKEVGNGYYFINNVNLMKLNDISSYEEIPAKEIAFFNYLKKMKEIPDRNYITEDFDVKKYLWKKEDKTLHSNNI